VVYADNDPIVHVHANALLTGSGTTSIVLADLREPEAILNHPKTRALIDFSQPVGLLLVAILHFITEAESRPGSSQRSGTGCLKAATWSCRMRPPICARKPRRTRPTYMTEPRPP
jgi:hypothetical protein